MIGEKIKRYLHAQGITVAAASAALGYNKAALQAVVSGRTPLSVEMALKLEIAFNINGKGLLVEQLSNAIAHTEENLKANKFEPLPIKPRKIGAPGLADYRDGIALRPQSEKIKDVYQDYSHMFKESAFYKFCIKEGLV